MLQVMFLFHLPPLEIFELAGFSPMLRFNWCCFLWNSAKEVNLPFICQRECFHFQGKAWGCYICCRTAR